MLTAMISTNTSVNAHCYEYDKHKYVIILCTTFHLTLSRQNTDCACFKKVERKIEGTKREEVTGELENYIMRSFLTFTLQRKHNDLTRFRGAR